MNRFEKIAKDILDGFEQTTAGMIFPRDEAGRDTTKPCFRYGRTDAESNCGGHARSG